jgi:hypothetical protein
MDERKANGQFAEGGPGGPGRPPKARELAYLAILKEVVTLDAWREIVAKAVEDATASADPIARNQARRFLAEYAIGKPTQSIRVRSDSDPFEDFASLSDEELEAIASDTDDGEAGPRREEASEE